MQRARVSLTCTLAACCALFVTTQATSQIRMPQSQALEDAHQSLERFYAALRRTRGGGTDAVTRVLYLGDSAVVSDGLTGELRRRLQNRFGDSGHGFLLPGQPWVWYRHHDVRHSGEGWHYDSILHPPADRLFGLPFLLSSAAHHATATYGTMRGSGLGSRVSHIETMYLERPNGGTFSVQLDDTTPVTVSTAAAERRAAYHAMDFADGPHEITIRANGDGLVEMFGTVMERESAGVVLDAVGVNGAHVRNFLFAEPAMLNEHMRHRAYDLVAIQLGTNMSTNLAPARFGEQLRSLVRRIRHARPEASCLLVAPFDRRGRRADGTPGTPPYIPAIVQQMHTVAEEFHCAFWNTYAAMGGENSFVRWQSADLAGGDGSHLAQAGYSHLAHLLDDAIMRGVERAAQ
ncbi:MAG: hypothetical protein IPK60_05590 [Sandaracinaceae bacterium]|jgi:lysophospholipase L1-like esterase|nr:hypothetical protein [Sandaracinaceae bacterium]